MESVIFRTSWAELFMVAGAILGGIACLLTIFSLLKKLRARHSLVFMLSNDRRFVKALAKVPVAKMQHDSDIALNKQAIDHLQKLIIEHMASLAIEDQKLLAPPLWQPSNIGRARYIGRLAKDVDLRLHQAA